MTSSPPPPSSSASPPSSSPPPAPPSSAPPPNGERLILDALAELELFPELKADLLGGTAAADVAIGPPLPVYSASLSDVTSSTHALASELTGWRYALSATLPTRPLATADVAWIERAWVLAGINHGEIAMSTASALSLAATLPEWKSHEPRILQVGALYTLFVWLRDPSSPAGDRYVPIADPDSSFKPGAVVDAAAVLGALQRIAGHYQTSQP